MSKSSGSSSSRNVSSPSVNIDSQARVVSESVPGDEQDGGMSKIEMIQANNAINLYDSPEPTRPQGSPLLSMKEEKGNKTFT